MSLHEGGAPVVPGEILAGKYRVDRVLAVGGMGVVVAATHIALDEQVALKFMLPDAFAHPDSRARFLREARAAVKLKSEHVAKILDTGVLETGAPYIVMEFLRGRDLSQLAEERGALEVSEAAEYVIQACDALAEAHALGIVHRDLKPANLFLAQRSDGSPLVKVLDFGISKADSLNESGLAMTKTSALMGSPLYMSPEQMRSAKAVDARTDVWSLGVILYELAGGRVPFNSDTLGGLMSQILVDPPPPLSHLRSSLPPQFVALVDHCLQKSVAERCQNVAELAVGLAPFCPSRSRPIVDRITTLLGADTSTSSRAIGRPLSATAPLFPAVASSGHPIAAGSTAGGVVSTQSHEVSKRSAAGAIAAALAGVVVLGLIVAGGIVYRRHPSTPFATDGAGANPPPTSIVSTPPTTQAAPLPSVPASSLSGPSPLPPSSTANRPVKTHTPSIANGPASAPIAQSPAAPSANPSANPANPAPARSSKGVDLGNSY